MQNQRIIVAGQQNTRSLSQPSRNVFPWFYTSVHIGKIEEFLIRVTGSHHENFHRREEIRIMAHPFFVKLISRCKVNRYHGYVFVLFRVSNYR